MKKIISLLLAALMIVAAVPVFSFAADDEIYITDYAVGDTIEFGSYPQSRVTDADLISALDAISADWVSYNYYISSTKSDYMMYKDVTFNGEKYRGVSITENRPYYTYYGASASNSYQDDNGYTADSSVTYWFRYEPITWRVLDPDAGLVVSEDILDSQCYYYSIDYRTIDGTTIYSNNWEYSEIRTWLNDDFLNTAFNSKQQATVATTTLDNTAYSMYGNDCTRYNANATNDKVYLLSHPDVINADYGFASTTPSSPTRMAAGSDYAKCQGLYVNSEGYSYWRCRSGAEYGGLACDVDFNGYAGSYFSTTEISEGIRPAMNLNPTSRIDKKAVCTHETTETVNAVAATCSKEGYTGDKICTLCGETVETGTTIAKLAHTPDAGTVSKEPTCTEEGVMTYKCTVCNEVIGTVAIPATGHVDADGDNICDDCSADLTPDSDETGCHWCYMKEHSTSILHLIYSLVDFIHHALGVFSDMFD